jgi:hypothetical protein
MILSLERRGLISRVRPQPISIKLIVQPADLPQLQSIDTSVARYQDPLHVVLSFQSIGLNPEP